LFVREFDDRFGWGKWNFASCADWLAWRCGIGLSAAREKVRIAHALWELQAISAAFEKGRISYSKVRALTRTVNALNEKELLDYALHGRADRSCRSRRSGGLPATAASRSSLKTVAAIRSASAAGIESCRSASGARCGRATAAARSRDAATSSSSKHIMCGIGRTAATRASTTRCWFARYAARGITCIMPTSKLCRPTCSTAGECEAKRGYQAA
jgi:hypothetical protein